MLYTVYNDVGAEGFLGVLRSNREKQKDSYIVIQ